MTSTTAKTASVAGALAAIVGIALSSSYGPAGEHRCLYSADALARNVEGDSIDWRPSFWPPGSACVIGDRLGTHTVIVPITPMQYLSILVAAAIVALIVVGVVVALRKIVSPGKRGG